MSIATKHLRFGLALAALVTGITWLVIGEHSPLDDAHRAPIHYVTLLINLPGMLIGVVSSGHNFKSTDPIVYAAVALQWTIIGTAASWLWSWLRSRTAVDNEHPARDA